jgi:hypothetical protein
MPEEECEHLGARKFARPEDAVKPLEQRIVQSGKRHEVKACGCGYYHIVEATDVDG